MGGSQPGHHPVAPGGYGLGTAFFQRVGPGLAYILTRVYPAISWVRKRHFTIKKIDIFQISTVVIPKYLRN